MKTLRLLKVFVHPVFVVDDGTDLSEWPVAPLEVAASEWPGFATGRFAKGMEELAERINAPSQTITKTND